MLPELKIGMSWKHVKIVGEDCGFMRIDTGGGTGIEEDNMPYFKAICDCGKEFRIWVAMWKGKKYIPDCGCGISLADGENVVTMISASNTWRQSMKKYALKNNISLSRAIVELSREGLEVVEGQNGTV